MKKSVVFAVFLAFCASFAYAENTRKVIATHYYEGNPKKETVFHDDSGKEVAREYYHIDGRVMGVKGSIPDGDIFEYYLSGGLKSKANYQSNLLLEESEYYETGIKRSSTENEWSGRNLVKSKYVIYYPNGSKQQQIEMDGDGNGKSRLYYDSGELFEDATLKDAYRSGPVTQYYKNGKQMLTGFMKDDMLDGPAKEYDSSGKLTKKVVYKENQVVKNVQ